MEAMGFSLQVPSAAPHRAVDALRLGRSASRTATSLARLVTPGLFGMSR